MFSSSSSSGSETEESCNKETMEFSGVVPYDENLEPLATEEKAKSKRKEWLKKPNKSENTKQDLLEKWKFLHGTTSKLFFKRYVDVLSLFLAFIMKLFRCFMQHSRVLPFLFTIVAMGFFFRNAFMNPFELSMVAS